MPVQIIADYAAGEQPRVAAPLSAPMHAPVSTALAAPLEAASALRAPSGMPCKDACKLPAFMLPCPRVKQTLQGDVSVLHGKRKMTWYILCRGLRLLMLDKMC